jgi:O-antigen ligase
VVVVFFATPLGAQRISQESATSVVAVEKGSGDTSLAWRIHKWEQLLPEWEGSPVLGRGLGTTLTEEAVFDDAYRGVPPHNEYVRYLVETGVLGLLALTLGLGLLVRRLLGARRTWARAVVGMRNAPMLALAVIFGCLVDSLADNTAIDTPTCYLTALLVAAVLAALRLLLGSSQARSAA